LLRNIDPANGLCNGTRLVVRGFWRNTIDVEIVVGQHAGNRYSFLEYRYVHLMTRCFRSSLRGSSFLSGWALPWRSTSHKAKLSRMWVCICLHRCSPRSVVRCNV
jgi:hypothetical protein